MLKKYLLCYLVVTDQQYNNTNNIEGANDQSVNIKTAYVTVCVTTNLYSDDDEIETVDTLLFFVGHNGN